MMKKLVALYLFAVFLVSLMTVSSIAMAGGCSGNASHDHDAKKKMERGA